MKAASRRDPVHTQRLGELQLWKRKAESWLSGWGTRPQGGSANGDGAAFCGDKMFWKEAEVVVTTPRYTEPYTLKWLTSCHVNLPSVNCPPPIVQICSPAPVTFTTCIQWPTSFGGHAEPVLGGRGGSCSGDRQLRDSTRASGKAPAAAQSTLQPTPLRAGELITCNTISLGHTCSIA